MAKVWLDTRDTRFFFGDTLRSIKAWIKEPLRIFLIKVGNFAYCLYPKKMEELDILYIFSTSDMGGAERVHLNIVRALEGYKSTIIFARKSKDKHFLEAYKRVTKVVDLSLVTEYVLGRYFMVGYMQKLIEHSRPKVVMASLGGFFYDIAATLQKGDISLVDILHAFDGTIEYYSLRAVQNLDKRVVIDRSTERSLKELYIQKGIPEKYLEKIEYIANGINVPDQKPHKGTGEGLKALFVGRDAKVKRVHLVKEIAQRYMQIEGQLEMTIVGIEGDDSESDAYTLAGKMEEVTPFYETADILLITSESEGFPMVVMEAMAYGVIPLCTEVGGIAAHIEDGVTGFLIREKKENDIVEAFIEIISRLDQDRSLLRQISANAYSYASKMFSIDRFNAEYNEMIESCFRDKDV